MPGSSVTDVLSAPLNATVPATPRRFLPNVRATSVPLLVWLLLVVVVPNLLLIGTSFLKTRNGFLTFDPSFANYIRLWGSTGFWTLLERTLRLSFLGCLFGALIAYPMAYYVARMVRRNKPLLVVLVILPLWISLLMRVFAWRLILGQSGVLNNFLVSTGILSKPSEAFLYTSSSVVLVFAYVSIPFIFISTLGAFEKIPQSLLEASADAGARGWQTFLRVVWPLTRRSLAIGFSLAFLVTVGDYVTPTMVGGIDGTTIGVVISSQFGIANNWPYGSAIAIVLILSVGVILGIVMWLCPSRGVLMGDEGMQVAAAPRDAFGRIQELALGTAFTSASLFLYAPLLLIILFSVNDSTLQTFPLQGVTLRWYGELLQNEGLLAAARRSLLVAAVVVTFSTVAGTAFALILNYGRVRGSRVIEFLLALPLAMPGVVLGVTMVLGTEWLAIPSGLLRTAIGQSSFVMPVTLMLVLARLRRLDPTLMEASLDAGATRLQTFAYVLLPLIRGAIIGGALLGLTLSADDVMVTLFLTGPSQTLPIWVFNQMRFGFTPTVNAVFSLLALVCLITVVATTWKNAAAKRVGSR
jgi:spermidine/putrescine transport system permease protein